MNADIITQVGILVLGCPAIWLVGRRESWGRWGYLLGLLSQVFWVWTAIINQQWGVLMLSAWYTYAWGQGVYNFLIKDDAQ
jgi:hypothetical protein